MKNYESLSHTRYDCKYHVVFIPKYRRKKIYGAIRRHLGEIFHELAKQKESRILEGRLKGVVEAIRLGCTYEDAAKAGGVTRMTLYRWLERGRREKTGPYCYICYAIESVQAKMGVEFLEAVRRSVFETTTIVREHVRELPDGTTLELRREWERNQWEGVEAATSMTSRLIVVVWQNLLDPCVKSLIATIQATLCSAKSRSSGTRSSFLRITTGVGAAKRLDEIRAEFWHRTGSERARLAAIGD